MSITVGTWLPARPELVFQAWIDPEKLRNWFLPAPEFRFESAEVDPRPGGDFTIRLRSPGDHAVVASGTYREVLPPERLDFTWVLSHATEQEKDHRVEPDESRVQIRLTPHETGTNLDLLHEGSYPADVRQEYEAGWRRFLDQLWHFLASDLDRFAERVTQGPRYHSRFGGLWTDLSNVQAVIDGKLELGLINQEDAERLRTWEHQGYLVLEGAAAPEKVDRFVAELERFWEEGHPDLFVEHYTDDKMTSSPIAPRYRSVPHKVLDVHGCSELAREVLFSPAVCRFLAQLFERPPMAFQSLTFSTGTEQDLHQDTAFVVLRSPLEFVGCWIALEDIHANSGELEYFVGSHRIEEYLWAGRCRAKPPGSTAQSEFLDWVASRPAAMGLTRERFLARKGDALIWHADLVHGGSKEPAPGTTRLSLVTHLCPVDNEPEYFGSRPHTGRIKHHSGAYYCSKDLRKETS